MARRRPSTLVPPPPPNWWEQQQFLLDRREAALAAEESWFEEERLVRFPERCEQRKQEQQRQQAEVLQQSQQRFAQAAPRNVLWVLTGVGRPALPRSVERVNCQQALDALKRHFDAMHQRDVDTLARSERDLRLKRAHLASDKARFQALMTAYGVTLPAP